MFVSMRFMTSSCSTHRVSLGDLVIAPASNAISTCVLLTLRVVPMVAHVF
jgi:hypothetical protein